MSTEKFGPETPPGHQPAGDLWRHTLARIPTLFGRMLYLSSLRNEPNGIYEHPALTQMVGQEEAAETLRRSHARAFQEWLCLNLEQQMSDLREYLAETPNPAALLASWASPTACSQWVPSAPHDVERRLFMGDFHILVALLTREYGAASPDRES